MGLFSRKPAAYEDSAVRLTLPPSWVRTGGTPGDILIFADPSGDRQLSICIYSLTQENPGPEDVLAAASDVYSTRIAQERSNLTPQDPFEAPGLDRSGPLPVGAFWGVQQETGRMFVGHLRSKGRRTIISYVESFTGTPQETRELAEQIAATLEVR